MKKVSFLVAIILIGAFIVSIKEKVSANTGIPERMDFSKLQLDTAGLGKMRTESLKTYKKRKRQNKFNWLLSEVRAIKNHFTAGRQFDADKWIEDNQKDLALVTVINNYSKLISDTARVWNFNDTAVLFALVAVESSGNPDIVHPETGATGLFQPLPETGAIYGYTQEDLKIPKNNTSVGIQYFLLLLRQFNGDVKTALEAYNMGPTAVDSLKDRGEFDLDNRVFHKKVLALAELVRARS